MSKVEILDHIKTEHNKLLECLSLISEAEMLESGVIANPPPAGQTVKDMLVHLTAWEQRMMACVKAVLCDQSVEYAKTHQFNAQVLQQSKDRPLDMVRLEFFESSQQTLLFVQGLTESELASGGVWRQVGYNTYNHYKWAYKALRLWLKTKGRLSVRQKRSERL